MFKTLLRTLSALSIVTITASAGFAQSTSPTDCDAPWNQNHEDCTVSTKIWLNDFTPSINAPAINSSGVTNGVDSGFVEFGAKGFKDDDDDLIFTNDTKRGKLNLKRANKTIGGVLFYRGQNADNNSYLYHAGIKSGTNLGRPLTEGLVSASWSNGSDTWSDTWTKGSFKAVGGVSNYNANKKNFELKVTFGGETALGKVGSISSLVNLQGQQHYRIDGEFDGKGVIEGTVVYGLFNASSDLNPYTGLGRIDGTLSGLIGDQGAVGVFYSVSDSGIYGLRGFSGGFVVKSNFDLGEAELFRTCVLSPFDESCSDTKFDSHKIARIEHCITGDNSATDITCVGAIGATSLEVSCISNPFQTACKDANANYAEQYMTARADRVTFCEQSANSGNAVCTDTIVADVCGVNPFGEVCEGDYDEVANNRLIACQQDVVADGTQCAHADTIIDVCELAPFKDECTWGAFDDERKKLIATCHNGGECADEVLERPNAGTWANSFKTEGNPEGLDDARGEELSETRRLVNPEERFLKNIKGAQTNERIKIYSHNNKTIYNSLNLKTTKFTIDGTSVPLGGDEEDGTAAFIGKVMGQKYNNFFAGIFSTTDLGAPLTTPLNNEPKTANWVGSILWPYYSPQNFVLEVNFESQSIEAFVTNVNIYRHDYHLKGDYDDNGVINGSFILGRFEDHNRGKLTHIYQDQILTGLIGKEGAVGAVVGFHAGGFVARPADLVVDETTGKNAETFLNETCTDNPFHHFCYLSSHRKTAIDNCITGKDVLNDDNCLAVRERHSCLRHPFDEQCKTTFDYHNDTMNKPYYEIARKNRSAFCNVPANENDDFCTDAERVGLCSYDPFNRLCDNTNGLYNDARKAVCKAGFDHPDCATDTYTITLNNVTAISWLAGIYKDKGVLPQTEPDTVRRRHQFLQDTADELNTRRLNTGSLTDYQGNAIVFKTLNFKTATFDGLKLGGNATGGVAWFLGYYEKNPIQGIVWRESFAGIFSSTDLGAPLVETKKGMKFYGKFQTDYLERDFTLDVKFNEGSTDGSEGKVEALIHTSADRHYLLSGDFDANGVISGTVDYGVFENHILIERRTKTSILTGLIGQEGAVGAFVGKSSVSRGGFVAVPNDVIPLDPNVKFSDWVRSFGNKHPLHFYAQIPDPQRTRFLQGRRTDLSTSNLRDAVRPNPLTLANGDLGGEGADGVAYVFGYQRRNYNYQTSSYDIITKHHYSGILSGTNLGAA